MMANSLTYADAIHRLEECALSGEDCKLLVQHNINGQPSTLLCCCC